MRDATDATDEVEYRSLCGLVIWSGSSCKAISATVYSNPRESRVGDAR